MQRMSGMDAAFLYLETPTMHMHVVGVVVLDPAGVPGGVGLKEILGALKERVHLIPPLRRRVVAPPAGIDHPLWIEDPDFDLTHHVFRAPFTGPVSWSQLEGFTGEIASRPLDRSRPLWEMWVVEDMEDGSVAFVSKLHHAIMDGAAGGDLMASLFDLSPEKSVVAPPTEPWVPDQIPSKPAQVVSSLASFIARQKEAPGAMARTFGNIAGSAGTWFTQRAAGTAAPLTAPRTAINGALSERRTVSLVKVDLDDVREIRSAFGTKVNDVVLAAAATALRGSLAARGPLPTHPLVAAVPVGVRTEEAEGELGNRVSSMMVLLPLHPDDPVERLALVHRNTQSSKALHTALGTESLQEFTGFAAPSVLSAGARLYSRFKLARFHRPMSNTIISNVPGPPIDLYCAGARVTGIFPMGPVMEGVGVNITVLSEAHHLNVGVMACPDLVPDVEGIGEGFVVAVAELLTAARKATKQPAKTT
jgi:WS/DGAT/MGAT family acyltransferase